MAQVRVCDVLAVRADAPRGRRDRAVRAAPAEHEQLRLAVGVVDLELRDVGGDSRDLLRAQPRHQVVVLGVVRDVAGPVGLLEPADPVLEPRSSRQRPRPRERLLVAQVREELVARVRLGREGGRQVGQRVEVGQEPRLGAVREVGVGQQVDGRAVLERDPYRLDHRVEAVGRRAGSDDRYRRLAVPPVHHHQQVALFGLGRHPGGGAGALDVADQERQLEHDREPDGLRLEDDSRSGRGRDAERTAERGSDRSSRRGDLVFRLERADAEVLVAGELLEDGARRRDRVGAEEERQP